MSEDKPLWLRQLENLLGEQGAQEALEQLRAHGIDPDKLASFSADPMQMHSFAKQAAKMFVAAEGPVNWQAAQEIALSALARKRKNTLLSLAQSESALDALRVADLWLDPITSLETTVTDRQAWNGVRWLEASRESWQALIDPVAEKLLDELFRVGGEVLRSRGIPLEQMSARAEVHPFGEALGEVSPLKLVRASLAGFFGVQIGNILGDVALHALGGCDVGLPLSKRPQLGLLPVNVQEFAEQTKLPADEVLMFVAVRENAYARLFASVPWLWHHLNMIISRYVEYLQINRERLEEFVSTLIEGMQQQAESFFVEGEDETGKPRQEMRIPMGDLGSILGLNLGEQKDKLFDDQLFATADCARLRAELEQVQILLAVIEGWVERVSLQASLPYLTHAVQLQEMMRRRRATNYQLEKVLRPLFGLHLPPKYALAASKFWEQVEVQWGSEKRDEVWAHPSALPTREELEMPSKYFHARAESAQKDSVDLELQALLEGSLGWAEGLEPGQDSAGDALGGKA